LLLYEFRPVGLDHTSPRDHRPLPSSPRTAQKEAGLDWELPAEESGPKHMVAGYVFSRLDAMPRPTSRRRSEHDSPRTALEASTWQRSGLAPHDPQAIQDMLPPVTHAPIHPLSDQATEAEIAGFDELVSVADDDGGSAAEPLDDAESHAEEEPEPTLNQPEQQIVDRVAEELASEVLSVFDVEAAQQEGSPESALRRAPVASASTVRVEEDLERRTRLLTRIFQQKLKEHMVSVRVQGDAVSRQHARTIRLLRERYELHLAKAVHKVREVTSANRDAVALVAHCHTLTAEKERLREEAAAAVRELRTEQRERQRVEELRAALEVELASREEMIQKYRRQLRAESERGPQAVEIKVKRELEAAQQEVVKLHVHVGKMEVQTKTTNDALAASREAHEATKRALESERRQRHGAEGKHAAVVTQMDAVERTLVSAKGAMGNVGRFLERMRSDLDMDTSCLCCLGELRESTVIVPCGHSVCHECVRRMETDSSSSALGHDMFCPVCRRREEEGSEEDDDDVVQPSEAFPNQMLDTILSRLRLKAQDLSSLLLSLDGLMGQMEVQRPET
jgi:diadenosine tetraphosphate (Ap4A) HIT family hydrolase